MGSTLELSSPRKRWSMATQNVTATERVIRGQGPGRERVKDSATQLTNEAVTIEQSGLRAPGLTYVSDRRRWRLEQAYDYEDGTTAITVPQGFVFDLSSVPRPFWWLIAPFELSVVAPLLHDFLYGRGGVAPEAIRPPRAYSRRETDRLFRKTMEQEAVPSWRRTLGYASVRMFGGAAWKAQGDGI